VVSWSRIEMNQGTYAETMDSAWKGLYRAGGAAALIAAVLFRRNLGAEFSLLRMIGVISFGPATVPSSAMDWFTLLQNNRLVGLTLLELFDVVNYALVGLIYLALYAALRRADAGSMAIATAFGFVGIAVYFASNQAFSMLSLSDQYAAATTDAQRSTFLAAGEAMLAINNPGAIYQGIGVTISLFLVTLAGLIISVVMLRSGIFSRATATVGILAHGFGLGYFVALAFAPAINFLPPSISAPFLLVWYILIARRLFQLGSGVLKEEAQ
jgi:hypothetical protein